MNGIFNILDLHNQAMEEFCLSGEIQTPPNKKIILFGKHLKKTLPIVNHPKKNL